MLTLSVNNNDRSKGKETAPVTLVEYGDIECPYCRQAFYIVEEIQRRTGNSLRIVFRNFPLSEIHQHAAHAAYAAEAAAKQGKFWKMLQLLFENQERLEDQELIAYAKRLNLNILQFKKDMKSKEIIRKVKDDFMSGIRSGVSGTPTFFINGARFNGSHEIDSLLKFIMRKGGVINEPKKKQKRTIEKRHKSA